MGDVHAAAAALERDAAPRTGYMNCPSPLPMPANARTNAPRAEKTEMRWLNWSATKISPDAALATAWYG